MKGSDVPQGCVLLHPVNVAALPGQAVLKGRVLSFYKARLGQDGRSWTLKLGMLLESIPDEIKAKCVSCVTSDVHTDNPLISKKTFRQLTLGEAAPQNSLCPNLR